MASKNISWDDYFMALAKISSLRSKDPITVVGACIINKEKRVIGLGYNGMPKGNDESFSWQKDSNDHLNSKYSFVVHAEINAILNINSPIEKAKLYTTLFPCSNCAKIIAQTGINEIIFLDKKNESDLDNKISEKIFNIAKIKFRKLEKTEFVQKLINSFFEKKYVEKA